MNEPIREDEKEGFEVSSNSSEAKPTKLTSLDNSLAYNSTINSSQNKK